jgi:deazaflavin-dependent oxidoreductase (nitroreductase family)
MRRKDSLADLGFKALNVFHRTVTTLSGGHLGRRAFGMPVVDLDTVGRRSGLPRVTLLTVPLVENGSLVLVASKGGDDRAPDWYLNVVAHPDVEITLDGQRRPFRARTASPEEKTELWPRVVARYRGYATYQNRSRRDIPLVICDPR